MAERMDSSAYIFLAGPPGVGKSLYARILDSLNPAQINPEFDGVFRDVHAVPMRQLLTWHGYEGEPSQSGWTAYHNQLRKEERDDEVFWRLKEFDRHLVIIDAVRHEADIPHIQGMGGMILALTAPDEVCGERYMADTDDEKHIETAQRLRSMLKKKAEEREALGLKAEDIDEDELEERIKLVSWDVARNTAEDSGLQYYLRHADATINTEGKPSMVVEEIKVAISGFVAQRQKDGLLVSDRVEHYGMHELTLAS